MDRGTPVRCPETGQRYIVYQCFWAFWYKIEDHNWLEVQSEWRIQETISRWKNSGPQDLYKYKWGNCLLCNEWTSRRYLQNSDLKGHQPFLFYVFYVHIKRESKMNIRGGYMIYRTWKEINGIEDGKRIWACAYERNGESLKKHSKPVHNCVLRRYMELWNPITASFVS